MGQLALEHADRDLKALHAELVDTREKVQAINVDVGMCGTCTRGSDLTVRGHS
jgi:hypothetical protein